MNPLFDIFNHKYKKLFDFFLQNDMENNFLYKHF